MERRNLLTKSGSLEILWLLFKEKEARFTRIFQQLGLTRKTTADRLQELLSSRLVERKIYRRHGGEEIGDREKVVRGIKKTDSPLIEGYQICHNYVRPHIGLKGKTPAEVAGIEVEGKDKWLTIIQNASHRIQ
jgi:hypothetical protein